LIRKFLSGLSIPQQYICLAKEAVESPVSVYLKSDRQEIDVTDSHIFLGYKPLIIALSFSDHDDRITSLTEKITLSFRSQLSSLELAALSLRQVAVKRMPDKYVSFYEGTNGSHRFISSYHQLINSVREKFRSNSPGNISLEGNLHDMVRIAYSVARPIHVITVSDGEQMNMFPTDLHGAISEKHYISSLRKSGKANAQVENVGRIVLSRVDCHAYKKVYALGRNHMLDLRTRSAFECAAELSKVLRYPIPAFTLDYVELNRMDSFDIGDIHRIHTYEILNRSQWQKGQTLSHIHQYYAQWRLDNNIPTEMLLR
jgi:hypothetical protein